MSINATPKLDAWQLDYGWQMAGTRGSSQNNKNQMCSYTYHYYILLLLHPSPHSRNKQQQQQASNNKQATTSTSHMQKTQNSGSCLSQSPSLYHPLPPHMVCLQPTSWLHCGPQAPSGIRRKAGEGSAEPTAPENCRKTAGRPESRFPGHFSGVQPPTSGGFHPSE